MRSKSSNAVPLSAVRVDDPDACWVCGCVLADAGGDPSAVRESHHVVPRAYGGHDGPQVPMCIAHHDLTHLVATKLIAKRACADFLPADPVQRSRIMFLANAILNAHSKFNLDPSKRLALSITLPRKDIAKVDELAKFYGVSRSDLITSLLSRELSRVLPTTKT